MRNYITSNVCKNSPAIFAVNVKPEVYAIGYDRSGVLEIATLLGNPNKPTEAYPKYPSVLYKDGVIAAGNLFGSAAIMNVS